MAITHIPRQPDPIEKFTAGIQPYLQMMVQARMRQKMAQREREQSLQQAQQMFPEAFRADIPVAAREAGAESALFAPSVSPELQQKAYIAFTGAPKVPSKYLRFQPERAQQTIPPGFTLPLGGEMKYTVPTPKAPTTRIYKAEKEIPKKARGLELTRVTPVEGGFRASYGRERKVTEETNLKKMEEILKDFPDAQLDENGEWYVMRDGIKRRILED